MNARTTFADNTKKIFSRPLLGIMISLSLSSSLYAAQTETMVVSADGGSGVEAESAWGPAPTVAAKRSATGTKTDTPIEKNPQSVSVVTREEMEMRNVTSVKGAFNYTPGVLTGNRGSSDVIDALSIRGFSETNTNQYLDGLKLQGDNYSEFAIDPYFLERAELLRGPVSVLYGKSNPGGVVSLVSKRPTQETLREVQFQMGNDNLFSTGFDFGGALDDDGVYSYRLTGQARSQDAQQSMNKEKRYTIAPSFSWRPDDRTRIDLLTYFQNEPETGYYGWLPRQGTVVPITRADGSQYKLPTDFDEGEQSNKISRTTKMVGYNAEHSLNDTWTLRQNLRYADLRTDYRSIYGNGFLPETQQITRGSAVSEEKLNQLAVDTQAQAKFATGQVDHTLLLGVDFQRTRNDIDAQFGLASNLNAVDPQYGDNSVTPFGPYQHLNKQRQTGLYAQDQMEWNRWVLTLGGRYDYAMNSVYDRVADSVDRQNDQAFTWRGGLNYVFDNGIAPYFSYSEAFIPNAGSTYEGQAFDPSRAKQYEAGVKYVPKDRPVVLTAALYQLTKTKNLTADPDTRNHPNSSVQSGEIRSRGVELEAKAALNANVNLTASYTYTDAEYTEDTQLKGKTPVQVPKHMASLWSDYTFHETALSGVTIGAGVRYVGESQGLYAETPTNTSAGLSNQNFKVAGYTTVDAALKYDLGRFGLPGSTVGVNVNNLFNREYVASCYREYACYWGAERQIVGTATFRF